MAPPLEGRRILVAGGTGFLGGYVVWALSKLGAEVMSVSRYEGYDLSEYSGALQALLIHKPDTIVDAAGASGGVFAQLRSPVKFYRENLDIGMNMATAAAMTGIPLVSIGSPASYPELGSPFSEKHFWNGRPSTALGMAKRAVFGYMEALACEREAFRFMQLIPTNLYGPGDGKDEVRGSGGDAVIPSLIKRFFRAKRENAKQVICWGSGKATRSFLHVRDAAIAIALACTSRNWTHLVHLPGAPAMSIQNLAKILAQMVGWKGDILWGGPEGPGAFDGARDRTLESEFVTKALPDWKPMMPLTEGLEETVNWFRDQEERKK